jgi:hypothetical protein
MRRSASFGSSSLLVGLFALGCAGASELASVEAEAEPPVTASHAMATPPSHAARTTPPTEANPPPRPGSTPEEAAPFDSRWADEVRTVVAAYEGWGRVDDEMRWAPGLCRMPADAPAHVSESQDAATHGQKLYTLYAMDPVAYGARPSAMGGGSPIQGLSQVIVKESFAPIALDELHDAKLGHGPGGGMGEHGLRPAERDGRRFVAGERKGLYVMMKTTGSADGTDAGWVYATVEPDMITVTAVGVIDSCTDCHADAGDDRLFGLPGLAAAPSPSKTNRRNANAVPL